MAKNLFWYWINERHRIYCKRKEGEEPPWTNDPILQKYRFTNVFRRLDRVSEDLVQHINEHPEATDEDILFNVVLYRTFNLPSTYDRLGGWLPVLWWPKVRPWMLEKLDRMLANGEKIWTGAYMVTYHPKEGAYNKHCYYLQNIDRVARDIRELCAIRTLEEMTEALSTYEGYGRFNAYEFATDLTYTWVFENVPDRMTWANAGPGAKRGLNRYYGRPVNQGVPQSLAVKEMRELLAESREPKKLAAWVPPLEMRDIEHSLCEYDKYMRAFRGEGRPRATYNPYKESTHAYDRTQY